MAFSHTDFDPPERNYGEDDVSVDYADDIDGEVPPLDEWWLDLASEDYKGFQPKVAEYGTRDLIQIGRTLVAFGQKQHVDLPERVYGEVGTMFYLYGKVARAMEAYARGDLPSEDTLHDIGVYATMARAYRQRGGLQ